MIHHMVLRRTNYYPKYHRNSQFDLQNPFLTFEFGPKLTFRHWNPILTYKFGPKIALSHTKSYMTFELRPNFTFFRLYYPCSKNKSVVARLDWSFFCAFVFTFNKHFFFLKRLIKCINACLCVYTIRDFFYSL